MKYVKKYNERLELSIEDWCEKFKLTNYEIKKEGHVYVNDNVNLNSIIEIDVLPIQFGIVLGYFLLSGNNITTLKGFPKKVYSLVDCDANKLITLEGSPEETGKRFDCSSNNLTTLIGSPKIVNGSFFCGDNKLISLEGMPEKLGGYLLCGGNPIFEIYRLFPTHKSYVDSLDYNYLRGDKIIKLRFQEACEEAGVEMPESVEGYEYI